MKSFSLLLAASVLAWGGSHGPAGMDPQKALSLLREGNQRFIKHREKHPDLSKSRRRELSRSGQHPFAVILGCADSRVPPELIFDQGLGDLFVIRDAGNVIDDEVLGSIEYAVEHLGTRLVVVLGHEKCGAVTAAAAGLEAPGHIKTVVDSIKGAVEDANDLPGDFVHNCVMANAKRTARLIRESEPILKPLADSKKVLVVAADYDLETWKVLFLDLPADAQRAKK